MQPIGNGSVMIGMGERTTPQAVQWIARALFRAGSARQVLAVHLPKSRSYMHLDTVITMCDRDLVTAFPRWWVRHAPGRSVRGVRRRPGDRGAAGSLPELMGRALGVEQMRVIETGGDASEPSASSGTTATTSSRSNPGRRRL